jgi:hypothetical protein
MDNNSTWQLLDQISLPVGLAPVASIITWLTIVLSPFSLSPGLVEKIQASIQEAASTNLAPSVTSPNSYPVILKLHTPRDAQSSQATNKNWGFYRVGKTMTSSESGQPVAGRSIEIYLYPEG